MAGRRPSGERPKTTHSGRRREYETGHSTWHKRTFGARDNSVQWQQTMVAPRSIRPILEAVRRTSGFAEVVGDYDEATALYEARRRMSCGNCFECDNCYGVCSDDAVIKLGPGKRFQFNYDCCKGRAICVSECSCGAIKMVPETI